MALVNTTEEPRLRVIEQYYDDPDDTRAVIQLIIDALKFAIGSSYAFAEQQRRDGLQLCSKPRN
jgi:hypothetical protein